MGESYVGTFDFDAFTHDFDKDADADCQASRTACADYPPWWAWKGFGFVCFTTRTPRGMVAWGHGACVRSSNQPRLAHRSPIGRFRAAW